MIEPSDTSATRLAYDTVAVDYAELLRDELASKPIDRALLAAFAELIRADGNEPVADVGCGPGRVTFHLHRLGLQAFGIDLSPGMIRVARQAHAALRFEEGSMEALDLADESLGGIVAWYSIIHTPPERLPLVFAEFARVLASGGHLLLAFQAGDEPRHLTHAYGHNIALDAYRLPPERITTMLNDAGLAVRSQLLRAPDESEKAPQAFLLARKL
ncbi:class I SAM-dependent methyltransferase [Cryobacterium sp. PH31-L1]|uniref:class I SAM-dependent methyltransferase n=1 Tax=Cryobacterium sp. PH31-L1 TaxID=3046199 RepID=UPI0024BAD9F2|nr:class I SAM-dependent methyltransferase [Cryobacterium sp. PH31-L1]MDJ0378291.1 class I SAM-dependent methyltransferase [Cryobacterium sp. PH31-L1]